MLRKCLCCLLLLLAACHQGNSPNENFYVFLAFGQSNMEGQGTIESQDLNVDQRFKVLQSLDCPSIHREKGQWYTATPPLCQCESGLGPSDYFGRTMVEGLPEKIKVGIITVAVGGCDIRLFDKDQYQHFDDTYQEAWFADKVAAYGGNPYNHLLELAKQAHKDGVIKGILLHQGETNTGDENWPLYVKKIYEDLLLDLDLNAERIPLIAGEVVQVPNSCCASMNPIINQLPKVVNTAHVVSSENCTAMDNAHFDAAGYREMGRRYARKMLQVISE